LKGEFSKNISSSCWWRCSSHYGVPYFPATVNSVLQEK